MGEVTGFTAARAQAIEDQAIVDGTVVGNNLILTRNNNDTIDAGSVRGPQGIPGPPGGLGEAPTDGANYGRRNESWVVLPPPELDEAPFDGIPYARYDGEWIVAPGTLLGEMFNSADNSTSLSTSVAFAGGGTKTSVLVPQRGVTVDIEAVLSHSGALQTVGIQLFVDGIFHVKSATTEFVPAASAPLTTNKRITILAGELSVGEHLFEVKAKQAVVAGNMLMYESSISVRAN